MLEIWFIYMFIRILFYRENIMKDYISLKGKKISFFYAFFKSLWILFKCLYYIYLEREYLKEKIIK